MDPHGGLANGADYVSYAHESLRCPGAPVANIRPSTCSFAREGPVAAVSTRNGTAYSVMPAANPLVSEPLEHQPAQGGREGEQ